MSIESEAVVIGHGHTLQLDIIYYTLLDQIATVCKYVYISGYILLYPIISKLYHSVFYARTIVRLVSISVPYMYICEFEQGLDE